MPLSSTIHILLADDDQDDILLFKNALEELSIKTTLETARNGVELMELFSQKNYTLPDILFLDLNMPLKNGFECLLEIKANKKLKQLPIIILSTSFTAEIVNILYTNGAQHYICKPKYFSHLKAIIFEAIALTRHTNPVQPAFEKFVLTHEFNLHGTT